jgi:DNA repair photolyase
MEPRAATPAKRLDTIRKLAESGIPVSVLVAPLVPGVNDHEIEDILQATYAAGAREAGYVLLRLPHELKEIMRDWLSEHYPDKLKHVFALVGDTRAGKLYDSSWGKRQTGVGPYAWMIGRRFEQSCARFGFNRVRRTLRTDLFTAPMMEMGGQMTLF